LPARRPSGIEIMSARHPTPDEASQHAAERALALVGGATGRDLVLVLLSGGRRRFGRRRRRVSTSTPRSR